ncbi:hypothetical protein MIR68_000678 [Amoeboaphelidium protococcarum]|nr:hypothetical protein MIR68_000678 [Amoeboaphelidium protococcarum]
MYVNFATLLYIVFWIEYKQEQIDDDDDDQEVGATGRVKDLSRRFKQRIGGGFIGQCLCLVVIPSVYFIHIGNTDLYVAVILLITAVLAVATAFLDASVISLASLYPQVCQEKLQVGVGLSTLIGCLYRVITKISFSDDSHGVVVSSIIYFYCTGVSILFCLWIFVRLMHNQYTRKVMSRSQQRGGSPDDHRGQFPVQKSLKDSTLVVVQGQQLEFIRDSDQDEDGEADLALPKLNNKGLEDDFEGQFDDRRPLLAGVNPNEKQQVDCDIDRRAILKQTMPWGLQITVLFTSTLCTWPALISVIQSHQWPELNGTQWYPLILLTVFAAFDVIGRFMVGLCPWIATTFRISYQSGHGSAFVRVWAIVICRLALIPLTVLCVLNVAPFAHDSISLTLSVLLGWTNGYVGSLSIINLNQIEFPLQVRKSIRNNDECSEDQEYGNDYHQQLEQLQKKFIGTLTSFYLNFGLVLGASLGLVFERVLSPYLN